MIDACPECRGVWLDCGELDKILVRERQLAGASPEDDFYSEVGGRQRERSYDDGYQHERRGDHEHGGKRGRRRGLLEQQLDSTDSTHETGPPEGDHATAATR